MKMKSELVLEIFCTKKQRILHPNKPLVSVYCMLSASHRNFAEMHPYFAEGLYWIPVRRRKVSFHLKTNRWRLRPFLTLPTHSTYVFLSWLLHWDCTHWGKHYYFLFSFDLTLLSTSCTGGWFFLAKTAEVHSETFKTFSFERLEVFPPETWMWELDAKRILRSLTTTMQQHFHPVLDSEVLGRNYILFWCIRTAPGYPVVYISIT